MHVISRPYGPPATSLPRGRETRSTTPQVTEVRAADGTLLQTVFHTSFSETDTNSASGRRWA